MAKISAAQPPPKTPTPSPIPAGVPPPAPKAGTGEVADWFGDGYLHFKVVQSGQTAYPDQIKLKDGREARVIRNPGDGSFNIKLGRQRILAVPLRGSGGAFAFYEPRPRGVGKQGDVQLGDGSYARPLGPVSPEQDDLIKVFKEASAVASGSVEAHLDPKVIQAKRDLQLAAAMGPTRKQAERLAADNKRLTQAAAKANLELTERLKPLTPLIEKGELAVRRDEQGKIHFDLQQSPGMSNSEFAKLHKHFDSKLQLFEMELGEVQDKVTEAVSNRDATAAALYESLNRPEMEKYFSMLPPDKRIAEFNTYASALAGTPSGQRMADDLFNTAGHDHYWPAVDKQGVLKPRPGSVGATVLQGAYDSPASRRALQGLVLSMAPHLEDGIGSKAAPTVNQRMFELNLGRKLTPEEADAVWKMATVGGPREFTALVTGAEGTPEAEARAGVVTHLLGTLGEVGEGHAHADAPKAPVLEQQGVGAFSATMRVGASYLSLFAIGQSLHGVASEGASLENMVELAENTSRGVETWSQIGSLAGGPEWLETTGKVAGAGAAFLGLASDLIKFAKAESPEGQDSHFKQALASGAIVAGTLLDAPMLALVGLGWKLFGSKTSESYDQTYGDLERGLKT